MMVKLEPKTSLGKKGLFFRLWIIGVKSTRKKSKKGTKQRHQHYQNRLLTFCILLVAEHNWKNMNCIIIVSPESKQIYWSVFPDVPSQKSLNLLFCKTEKVLFCGTNQRHRILNSGIFSQKKNKRQQDLLKQRKRHSLSWPIHEIGLL